jgi:hypothetical protein
MPTQSRIIQSSQATKQNNDVDIIMDGLNALPPAQSNEAVTKMIDELLNWDKKIAEVRGKRVKSVGNPSQNQTEQMMAGLRNLPPEELHLVTRDLLTALAKGRDNVQKFKKGEGVNEDDTRPAE